MAKAVKREQVSQMIKAAVQSGVLSKTLQTEQLAELGDRLKPTELGWYVVGGSGYVLIVADEGDDDDTTDTEDNGDTGDTGGGGTRDGGDTSDTGIRR